MRRERPALFKGRHFEPEIILLCVRRYLRYALSLRNLEEIMAVRNVDVDHVTIWRWIQRYAPELSRRCPRELRKTNGSWRVDETYLRVAGKWTYLYRAADSTGDTIDFLLSGSEQNQKTVAKAVQALLKNYPPHERAQRSARCSTWATSLFPESVDMEAPKDACSPCDRTPAPIARRYRSLFRNVPHPNRASSIAVGTIRSGIKLYKRLRP